MSCVLIYARHWPVFWASLAVVLVTWGLVPTQAGIFSVTQSTRTTSVAFNVSTAFVPADRQVQTLSFRYAQSTYAIATLNETLPPFMAPNYTLSPFVPAQSASFDANGPEFSGQATWTAPTTMFSLDLYCEDASHKANKSAFTGTVSSSGCNFTLGLTGNLTMGENRHHPGDTYAIKKFSAMHVGYEDPDGYAVYSLDQYCPKNHSKVFYAAFQRNKVST